MPDADILKEFEENSDLPNKDTVINFFQRKMAKEVFFEKLDQSPYSRNEVVNLYLSQCFSCEKLSIWLATDLLYPVQSYPVEPHDEMPTDISTDFSEAAAIVDRSPRGAAALLRLCLQKLTTHLGGKGKNLDDDIGALVKRGLDIRIQRALDIVRVTGNNAVHPGKIDLRDDKATAIELFRLVNLIVEAMIAMPKHVESMYDALPEGAKRAIEKRDGLGGEETSPPDAKPTEN